MHNEVAVMNVSFKKMMPVLFAALLLFGGYGVWTSLRNQGPGEGFGGGNGRIEATEVDIATKTAGRIDAILVKENHILAAGSIAAAMAEAKQLAEASDGRCKFIQIEVETLNELNQALAAGAKMILLDNMSLDQLRQAVAITAGNAVLEASGNVSLETVRAIAETGVDRISIGGLTKDVRALDLSMRLQGQASCSAEKSRASAN